MSTPFPATRPTQLRRGRPRRGCVTGAAAITASLARPHAVIPAIDHLRALGHYADHAAPPPGRRPIARGGGAWKPEIWRIFRIASRQRSVELLWLPGGAPRAMCRR